MNRYMIKAMIMLVLTTASFWGCSKKGMSTADMLKFSGRENLPTQQEYPDDGGVYLFEKVQTQITFNPSWQAIQERKYHAAIMYFNDKAEPWLTPTIYLGKKDKLKSFHARTIKPNGEVIELTKNDLHGSAVKNAYVTFSDNRSLSFTFPGVVPGAIVEYSYRLKRERSYFYNQTWKIQSGLPKIYSYFSIEFPELFLTKKHGWTFLPANIDLAPPQTKNGNRTTGLKDFKTVTYYWSTKNIKAFKPGPQAPPYDDIAQYLRVDYKYKNWNALSKIYWKSIKDKFDISEEGAIKDLAEKIAGDAQTDDEKISRVYNYLQKNFRYLAIDIGKSGLIPNTAENIEKNKYGDCKDMTVLGNCLLGELGIKARPALVKTRDSGRLPNGIVTFDFNHMITLAETSTGKNYWLDATGSSCTLGETYPGVEGTRALVLKPDGTSMLKKIPFSPAKKNNMQRNVELYLDKDGKVKGTVDMTLKGHQNLAVRSSLRNQSKKEMRTIILKYANKNWPDMHIDSLSYDDPQQIAESFNIHFNLQLPDVPVAGKGLYIINPAIFKISANLDRFVESGREYPIFFSDRFSIDDHVTLHYDPNTLVLQGLPEHIYKQYAFGRIKSGGRKTSDGTMSFKTEYRIESPLIGVANYEDFRTLEKSVARSQDQKIVLKVK